MGQDVGITIISLILELTEKGSFNSTDSQREPFITSFKLFVQREYVN